MPTYLPTLTTEIIQDDKRVLQEPENHAAHNTKKKIAYVY